MPPLTWCRNLHASLQAQRAGPGLDAEDTGQLDIVSAFKELTVPALACIPLGAGAHCHLVSVPFQAQTSWTVGKSPFCALSHPLISNCFLEPSGHPRPGVLTHRKYEVRLRPRQSMMLKRRKQQMGLKN